MPLGNQAASALFCSAASYYLYYPVYIQPVSTCLTNNSQMVEAWPCVSLCHTAHRLPFLFLRLQCVFWCCLSFQRRMGYPFEVVSRRRPAATMSSGQSLLRLDDLHRGRILRQFPNHLCKSPRLALWWDPVRGTRCEWEPTGFGSFDDDPMNGILQILHSNLLHVHLRLVELFSGESLRRARPLPEVEEPDGGRRVDRGQTG